MLACLRACVIVIDVRAWRGGDVVVVVVVVVMTENGCDMTVLFFYNYVVGFLYDISWIEFVSVGRGDMFELIIAIFFSI